MLVSVFSYDSIFLMPHKVKYWSKHTLKTNGKQTTPHPVVHTQTKMFLSDNSDEKSLLITNPVRMTRLSLDILFYLFTWWV